MPSTYEELKQKYLDDYELMKSDGYPDWQIEWALRLMEEEDPSSQAAQAVDQS